MTVNTGGVISFQVGLNDVAQIRVQTHDDRSRQLIMRSGLPGAIDIFSENPQKAANARLQLVQSFASRKRK